MVTWIQRYSKGDERDLRAFGRDRIQKKSDLAFEREVNAKRVTDRGIGRDSDVIPQKDIV